MAEKIDKSKTEKKPRVQKPPDPNAPKCLNPACARASKTRGLCITCYGVARKAVKDGLTSWDVLIAKGRATAKGGRNGTLRSKAREWLMGE